MNRSAELLWARLARYVGNIGAVIRTIAVGTPVALECASGYVDNGNTSVLVSIGEISFVGFDIDGDFSNPTKMSSSSIQIK